MASSQEVQNYLAYWFQLGKSVYIGNSGLTQRPEPVLEGHQLSRAFQDCWRSIMAVGGRDCYLAGTDETIEQLLSPQWEITDCARCSIPVAISAVMPVAQLCTCGDIDHWPNDELPPPHLPINDKTHLTRLKSRLSGPARDARLVDHDPASNHGITINNQHE
ncbi:MAG: hypothetical protein AAF282_13025 [Cyanobacteria bacterium P01_A01_bin.15]